MVKSKKVYFAKTGFALALLALVGCGAVKKDEDASAINAGRSRALPGVPGAAERR